MCFLCTKTHEYLDIVVRQILICTYIYKLCGSFRVLSVNNERKLKKTEILAIIDDYLAETDKDRQWILLVSYLCTVSSREQWCSSGIYKSPTDEGQRLWH